MYRVIVASESLRVDQDTKRAISRFTGNNNLLNPEEKKLIEIAIESAQPLDEDYEYKRGIAIEIEDLKKLVIYGYYEPKKLTSWSDDEGMAQAFALENTSWNDKIPVVLVYRGTKWLKYAMEVSKYSQHPEEFEAIFSSRIKMSIDRNEIFGIDLDSGEQLDEIVYINLYD